MLISEVMGWHWLISWDNPRPANSKTMLATLAAMGKLTQVQTKTTFLFAPKSTTTWRGIRAAIVNNLDPGKGNVVYVNMRSGGVFEFGSRTGGKWRKVN